MGLQIRRKLSSLGPIFAVRRSKPDRLLVDSTQLPVFGTAKAWLLKTVIVRNTKPADDATMRRVLRCASPKSHATQAPGRSDAQAYRRFSLLF